MMKKFLFVFAVICLAGCAEFVENTNEVIEGIGSGVNDAADGTNEGAAEAQKEATEGTE